MQIIHENNRPTIWRLHKNAYQQIFPNEKTFRSIGGLSREYRRFIVDVDR